MTVEPLDPRSPEGAQVTEHLEEWVADVTARLIRDGEPLPPCLLEAPANPAA